MKYFSRDFNKYFVFDENYKGYVAGQRFGL
jgi:hypothetical protein